MRREPNKPWLGPLIGLPFYFWLLALLAIVVAACYFGFVPRVEGAQQPQAQSKPGAT